MLHTIILLYQAISGIVRMEVSTVSSNNDMAELRAAFSDIRIESQPTMEVVTVLLTISSLKDYVPRLAPIFPTQNTCWRDQGRSRGTREVLSSFLPCPVTLYTFSSLLRSKHRKLKFLLKYTIYIILISYYKFRFTYHVICGGPNFILCKKV